MSFRPATEEDVPFLLELRRQTMAPHEEAAGIVRSPEENLRRVRVYLDWGQILLQDGQPVGLLKVVREGQEWILAQLQLSPAVQGKGLGTRVLQSLIAEARARKASIHLGTLKTNPARRLYERLGFVIVADLSDEYEMTLEAP